VGQAWESDQVVQAVMKLRGGRKNNFPFFKSPHPTLSPKGRGAEEKLFFGRPLI